MSHSEPQDDRICLTAENEQVCALVAWFLQHYEDPVENCPYDSAEGGYQFIYGRTEGDWDIQGALNAQFPDAKDEDVVRASKLLADQCWEWSKKPPAHADL